MPWRPGEEEEEMYRTNTKPPRITNERRKETVNKKKNKNNDEKWRIDFTEKNSAQRKFNCYSFSIFMNHKNNEKQKNKNINKRINRQPGTQFEVTTHQHTFRFLMRVPIFGVERNFSLGLEQTIDAHSHTEREESYKRNGNVAFFVARTNAGRSTVFVFMPGPVRYYGQTATRSPTNKMSTLCKSVFAPLNKKRKKLKWRDWKLLESRASKYHFVRRAKSHMLIRYSECWMQKI